jgi:hypothetical protein
MELYESVSDVKGFELNHALTGKCSKGYQEVSYRYALIIE